MHNQEFKPKAEAVAKPSQKNQKQHTEATNTTNDFKTKPSESKLFNRNNKQILRKLERCILFRRNTQRKVQHFIGISVNGEIALIQSDHFFVTNQLTPETVERIQKKMGLF